MGIVEQIAGDEVGRRRLRTSGSARLEVVGEIEACASEDVAAALEAARVAEPSWADCMVDYGITESPFGGVEASGIELSTIERMLRFLWRTSHGRFLS